MRRWLSILALATAASVAPNGQQPPTPEPQPPVFRTEANYVRVDAFPTKDGRPVHGLTAKDFEILEDGVPQNIASFEHVVIEVGTPPEARVEPNSVREGERMAANPRNRVFVVFLDVPHVQVPSSHAIKEPLIALLGRTMGPDDLVAVMTPSMSPTQLTFGRKTDVIERGLRENWPWGMRDQMRPTRRPRAPVRNLLSIADRRRGHGFRSGGRAQGSSSRASRARLVPRHARVSGGRARGAQGRRPHHRGLAAVPAVVCTHASCARASRPGVEPIGVGPGRTAAAGSGNHANVECLVEI